MPASVTRRAGKVAAKEEKRVSQSPLDPHDATATELAGRAGGAYPGAAFLVYEDGSGHQQVYPLEESASCIRIGRGSATDLWLAWDDQVSRLHAELERSGDDWVLADDGLSANGTFCNGERLAGRRRLRDGDRLRLGATEMIFRAPLAGDAQATVIAPPD
jgi:pSer/pThr/pTyr-binding forkhead associated (FHA) protein